MPIADVKVNFGYMSDGTKYFIKDYRIDADRDYRYDFLGENRYAYRGYGPNDPIYTVTLAVIGNAHTLVNMIMALPMNQEQGETAKDEDWSNGQKKARAVLRDQIVQLKAEVILVKEVTYDTERMLARAEERIAALESALQRRLPQRSVAFPKEPTRFSFLE